MAASAVKTAPDRALLWPFILRVEVALALLDPPCAETVAVDPTGAALLPVRSELVMASGPRDAGFGLLKVESVNVVQETLRAFADGHPIVRRNRWAKGADRRGELSELDAVLTPIPGQELREHDHAWALPLKQPRRGQSFNTITAPSHPSGDLRLRAPLERRPTPSRVPGTRRAEQRRSGQSQSVTRDRGRSTPPTCPCKFACQDRRQPLHAGLPLTQFVRVESDSATTRAPAVMNCDHLLSGWIL